MSQNQNEWHKSKNLNQYLVSKLIKDTQNLIAKTKEMLNIFNEQKMATEKNFSKPKRCQEPVPASDSVHVFL